MSYDEEDAPVSINILDNASSTMRIAVSSSGGPLLNALSVADAYPYPNPVTGASVTFHYRLDFSAEKASINIYDRHGRLIFDDDLPINYGENRWAWDLADARANSFQRSLPLQNRGDRLERKRRVGEGRGGDRPVMKKTSAACHLARKFRKHKLASLLLTGFPRERLRNSIDIFTTCALFIAITLVSFLACSPAAASVDSGRPGFFAAPSRHGRRGRDPAHLSRDHVAQSGVDLERRARIIPFDPLARQDDRYHLSHQEFRAGSSDRARLRNFGTSDLERRSATGAYLGSFNSKSSRLCSHTRSPAEIPLLRGSPESRKRSRV